MTQEETLNSIDMLSSANAWSMKEVRKYKRILPVPNKTVCRIMAHHLREFADVLDKYATEQSQS